MLTGGAERQKEGLKEAVNRGPVGMRLTVHSTMWSWGFVQIPWEVHMRELRLPLFPPTAGQGGAVT